MATPKTILISGEMQRKEAPANGAITPGHLLEYATDGDVQVHDSAAGDAAAMFALENDLVGDDIADAYASGETVQYGFARPGAKIYAWLEYGENVAIGAYLESSGSGTLQALTGDHAVAVAVEAVNASAADARIKVEVL